MNEEILSIYKEYNYPSASKLYTILKGKYKLKDIESVLKEQPVRQLYYQKPNKDNGHNLATGFGMKFQCDLCFMDKFTRTNKGYSYILLIIDVFSRFAYAIPLKTKNVSEVTKAFESIKETCSILQSDNGSEFVGKAFQDMLEDKKIIHRTSVVGDHKFLGIIDRFTLTLKNLIYKNFIANDNTIWIDKLESIVTKYNNTLHNGLFDFTPSQVKNDEVIQGVLTNNNIELMKNQSNKITDIKEDENVRIKIPPTKFTRGFHPRWGDVEKVEKRVGNIVYINGKKHKITNVQIVKGAASNEAAALRDDVEVKGGALKTAIKEDRVKRALNKEGVSVVNIREKRERVIKYDKSLVGRRINRGNGETGTITKYENDGPFHFFVKYDSKAKMKSEWMDAAEVKEFII